MGLQVDLYLIREIVSRLTEIEEIQWVNITSGGFDIFINVATESIPQLLVLLQTQIAGINGIKKIQTFTTLEIPKDKFRRI